MKEESIKKIPIRFYNIIYNLGTPSIVILIEQDDGTCDKIILNLNKETLSKIKFTDGPPEVVYKNTESFIDSLFSKKQMELYEIYLSRNMFYL
ncbi:MULTISPECIES: hypothetical protein [Thermoanaerobacterium]|uniref:Uncharacterized protein n=3 Tax=Thermoanaerobacterium TaxID=28895 RepID=L0ILS1_THETR|nr:MULTISPECIES: hypothetical protein [Thermoanaerobacterium]AFK94281.1 hypothetical protein Tsac_2734 [Thermoanaerobacterium saccharolyticum JW/SL-YS485]AGB20455.1 hypothetical protein Thethe_02909 [Thermoanaerobacterium thermosaccharolyticum M0795]ETO39074.1 hypothetical protein V518_0781 [Thermoanaerobacterium aotearoense SCUT27]